MQAVILLIRKIIGRLSRQERQELAQALRQNDASNPTYKGFNQMFQVVRHLNISPALVSYLTTEVAGQLRGMSQEAIFNSWVEAQIGGVMGRLRARSKRKQSARETSEGRSDTGHLFIELCCPAFVYRSAILATGLSESRALPLSYLISQVALCLTILAGRPPTVS